MNKGGVLILFIFIGFLISFIKLDYWKQNILDGDSWGYYNYLPATFIHHDLGSYEKSVESTRKYKPSFKDPLSDKYSLYHKNSKTGKMVVKYTSGVAVMLSPFFAIAHLYAKLSGSPADGYSAVYRVCMGIGVMLWSCLGLFFLFVVLSRYFSRYISTVCVLALAFGTNLYYNSVYNSIMSHALLCSLYGILIYATDSYYKKPSQKLAVVLGLSVGLISLVRLNEVYCVLIPLLWGLTERGAFQARLKFLRLHSRHVAVAVLSAFLIFIPQIAYWKTFAGAWVFNGYIGEKFDFRHPHIMEGLFGYDNGWIVWSPIMALSLLGLLINWFKARSAFWPTLVLLPIHVYVIYSWWCWNYINGFGSRPMEHIYPLLSFALASFMSVFSGSKIGKAFVACLVGSAIILNIFQNYQMHQGLLVTQSANRAYYWTMLGQTKPSHDIMVARSSNEIQPKNPTQISTLYSNDFEDTTQYKGAAVDPHFSGKFSKCFTEQLLFMDTIPMPHLDGADYLKVSGTCFFKKEADIFHDVWATPFLFIQWRDPNGQNIRKHDSGINPFQFANNPDFSIYSTGSPGVWGPFYYYVSIPHGKANSAVLGIWNGQNTPFYIDDLKIELYKK